MATVELDWPTPVIDVDTHLTDADEAMWRPYLTGPEAALRPTVVTHGGDRRLDVAGMLLPKPAGAGVGSPLGVGATTHVTGIEQRVAAIAALGVTHALLLPGFVGLAALDHSDPAVRRVLARAHNRLVHDLSAQVAEIEFVPVVLPDDPEWTLSELARWRDVLPVRAVVSRPTTYAPRPYRDGLRSPVLAELAASGTVLVLHGATGYHQMSPVADLFDDYRLTHVFSHPFEQMVALADLVCAGALAGGLRVAIVEAGCGWLPWFAGRLQEHLDHTGGLPRIEMDVADLLRRQVLFGVEPGDEGIDSVLARFGPGMLAFGSDFPHWDAARPEDLGRLADRLGPDLTRQVLFTNAYRFLFDER